MKIAFEPDKKNIEAIKRNRPKPAICIYHSAEDCRIDCGLEFGL